MTVGLLSTPVPERVPALSASAQHPLASEPMNPLTLHPPAVSADIELHIPFPSILSLNTFPPLLFPGPMVGQQAPPCEIGARLQQKEGNFSCTSLFWRESKKGRQAVGDRRKIWEEVKAGVPGIVLSLASPVAEISRVAPAHPDS